MKMSRKTFLVILSRQFNCVLIAGNPARASSEGKFEETT